MTEEATDRIDRTSHSYLLGQAEAKIERLRTFIESLIDPTNKYDPELQNRARRVLEK